MKTVRTAKRFSTSFYSHDPARVVRARDGSFRTVGAVFAGRIRFRTVERAMRSVEGHAGFTGWQADA